jgi:hypothetical protein
MRGFVPPRSRAAARRPADRSRRPVAAARQERAHFAGAAGARRERSPPGPPSADRLPERLKTVMEAMSGFSLADVVVHRNSAEPARIGAAAFAKGDQIHLAPGQERHLPHEAWHVVQQKQGRVRTSAQMKGEKLNDEPALEGEADVMGARAAAHAGRGPLADQGVGLARVHPLGDGAPVQRTVYNSMDAMWTALDPGRTRQQIEAVINADPVLVQAYGDVAHHLGRMEFVYQNGTQPAAAMLPDIITGRYDIVYGHRNEMRGDYLNETRYVGAVLHEMMHIAAALQYATNAPPTGKVGHVANMNLPAPAPQAVLNPEFGLTDAQLDAAAAQMNVIVANWDRLLAEADLDVQNGDLSGAQRAAINGRRDYAIDLPGALAHYDTVLFDLLYYLRAEGVAASRSYEYASRLLAEANGRRTTAVGAAAAVARAPLPQPAQAAQPAPAQQAAPAALPAPPALSWWQRFVACLCCAS